MLKSNIDVFVVTSFLCSLEYPNRCLLKINEIFLWLSFYDMTVLQKAMYRPCDLDLWPMKVNIFLCIEYHPINILHKFQIDISSNSWEIKYQNIGRTHTQTDTHTHRQTDNKQYLATPSGGEVIKFLAHPKTFFWKDPPICPNSYDKLTKIEIRSSSSRFEHCSESLI